VIRLLLVRAGTPSDVRNVRVDVADGALRTGVQLRGKILQISWGEPVERAVSGVLMKLLLLSSRGEE
jgi:hypothetical protein